MRGRTSARILVVDDDEAYRTMVTTVLMREGHEVTAVASGEAALETLEDAAHDLIVLDVEMPGMSGLELLNRLRSTSGVPIMILSGHGAETERVLGLDIGADDYVVKPFLPRELGARVRALLRRNRVADTPAGHRVGELEIRTDTRGVSVRGDQVSLTHREFDLLAYLAKRPRQVVTRQQLLQDVWKSSEEWQDPATVTEHIRRLRLKVEVDAANPRLLRAVRNVGYCFVPDGED